MLNKNEIKQIIPQREPFLMIDEVEEYVAELAQQKTMMIDKKKQALLDEIKQIETMLEKYKQQEWKIIESFNRELVTNEAIVQEAKQQQQEIERLALYELRAKEGRLAELQKLLRQVCETLQQIQNDLQAVNNAHNPSFIMDKEAQ